MLEVLNHIMDLVFRDSVRMAEFSNLNFVVLL